MRHRLILTAILVAWPGLRAAQAQQDPQSGPCATTPLPVVVTPSQPVLTPPPPLPEEEQPPVPAEGALWTPGYWSYAAEDYVWVPGIWVQPPAPGLLWTPGYWGWFNGSYLYSAGYWGPRVGFYGGVNYGHGYRGSGYDGGRWVGGAFEYNRAVNNLGTVPVAHVYDRVVVNTANTVRVSYNGGPGGLPARPTPAESAVLRDRRDPPTAAQLQHAAAAQADPAPRGAFDHGRPNGPVTFRYGEMRGAPPAMNMPRPPAPGPTRPDPADRRFEPPAAARGVEGVAPPGAHPEPFPPRPQVTAPHAPTPPEIPERRAATPRGDSMPMMTTPRVPEPHRPAAPGFAPRELPHPGEPDRSSSPPRDFGRPPSQAMPGPAPDRPRPSGARREP